MVQRKTRRPASGESGSEATATARRPASRILVVEARFYEDIADMLVEGAIAELEAQGCSYERVSVPGALEIPQVLGSIAAAGLAPMTASAGRFAGVIVLGCVIRGETSHYDVVVNNANHWLMQVAIQHNISVGNGILTVDTDKQAKARARGGRDGKGGDAARACLALVDLARQFQGLAV